MTIENIELKDNKRKFILEKEIEKNKKILEKEMITKEEYEKFCTTKSALGTNTWTTY